MSVCFQVGVCVFVYVTSCAVISPVVSSGHAFLVDGPVKLFDVGEDGLVVDDDGLDDLVDLGLARHLVMELRRGHERRPEADGQVPRLHHVLIAVLGQAAEGRGQRAKVKRSPDLDSI